jgi:hypothetical protein
MCTTDIFSTTELQTFNQFQLVWKMVSRLKISTTHDQFQYDNTYSDNEACQPLIVIDVNGSPEW